jgi:hypothetical protein
MSSAVSGAEGSAADGAAVDEVAAVKLHHFRPVLTTFRIQNNPCVHRTYTPVYTNPTNSKIKTTPSSVQNNPGGSFLFNCEGNYQLMSFSRIFEKGYRPDKSNNLRSRSFSPQFA